MFEFFLLDFSSGFALHRRAQHGTAQRSISCARRFFRYHLAWGSFKGLGILRWPWEQTHGFSGFVVSVYCHKRPLNQAGPLVWSLTSGSISAADFAAAFLDYSASSSITAGVISSTAAAIRQRWLTGERR